MNKQVICIICPKGCKVTVSEQDGVYTTSGNACLRGNVYGIQEATEPKRILTTTVKITGASIPRCPVVSNLPILKDDLFKVISLLESVEISAPVYMNQVICANVLGSGIDMIAAKTMEKKT